MAAFDYPESVRASLIEAPHNILVGVAALSDNMKLRAPVMTWDQAQRYMAFCYSGRPWLLLTPWNNDSQLPLKLVKVGRDYLKPVEGTDFVMCKTAIRRRTMGDKTIERCGDWEQPAFFRQSWVPYDVLIQALQLGLPKARKHYANDPATLSKVDEVYDYFFEGAEPRFFVDVKQEVCARYAAAVLAKSRRSAPCAVASSDVDIENTRVQLGKRDTFGVALAAVTRQYTQKLVPVAVAEWTISEVAASMKTAGVVKRALLEEFGGLAHVSVGSGEDMLQYLQELRDDVDERERVRAVVEKAREEVSESRVFGDITGFTLAAIFRHAQGVAHPVDRASRPSKNARPLHDVCRSVRLVTTC